MSVAYNYQKLLEAVEKAANRAGKSAQDITIVVAAKYATIKQLKEVISSGATHIGENRAQDLLRHQDGLKPKNKSINSQPLNFSCSLPKWHFIGHLQTNKINKILGRIYMLQSLDSLRLAKALDKRIRRLYKLQKKKFAVKPLPCLIQVNIARDPAKFGVDPNNLYSFISKLADFNTLKIQGLMTMGKIWHSEKQARHHFAQMRQLFEQLKKLGQKNLKPLHLSMGMSSDFQWAIEEGATMIRIGRLLFNR